MLTAVAAALMLVSPGTASARLSAKASIQTKSGLTRIVVSLSSPRSLAAKARPRSVKVRISRKKSYTLSRVRGSAAAAAVSYGTWRSAGFKGSAAKPLVALAGTKITVLVGTRGGTVSLRPSLPKLGGGVTPSPPAPTPGAEPLFKPPGRDLTGAEALTSIKGYVANSRFTDCVAGWPNCAVEQRYLFCPNGLDAAYLRLTSSSGSDIISYGHVQPVGADQKADGSFAFTVSFLLNGKAGNDPSDFSYYTWNVSTAGIATGLYWPPGTNPRDNPANEQIGPLQYVRGAGPDNKC